MISRVCIETERVQTILLALYLGGYPSVHEPILDLDHEAELPCPLGNNVECECGHYPIEHISELVKAVALQHQGFHRGLLESKGFLDVTWLEWVLATKGQHFQHPREG